ncbi:MAG: glycosyltransferase [Lachnospiraceae bacterium]|nr:glycosyltransferase [Lachnospiraceae bacterium]
MKYITFAVPCYNSEDYLERCVDSLLPGGEDVGIILIDDGSTNRTGEMIDAYADLF